MGWGRGTEIFDQVADDLLEANHQWTGYDDLMDPSIVVIPLKNLYKMLCKLDWDNGCESKYWEHPVIGKILGNPFDEEDYND